MVDKSTVVLDVGKITGSFIKVAINGSKKFQSENSSVKIKLFEN
jgi:hypothetical protein